MSYSPNNVNVYTAAYSGAFAGMVSSGRYIKNANMATYANRAAYAGAWAQEFDTLWGMNTIDLLQIDSILAHSQAVWEERTPTPDAPSVTKYVDPNTYTEEIAAIVAAINAEETFFAQQGITPPVYPPTPVIPPGYTGGYTEQVGLGLGQTYSNPQQGPTTLVVAEGGSFVTLADNAGGSNATFTLRGTDNVAMGNAIIVSSDIDVEDPYNPGTFGPSASIISPNATVIWFLSVFGFGDDPGWPNTAWCVVSAFNL